MSLLIFKAATVSFFILYLTQLPIQKEQNMSEPSYINSWWPRQDARTIKRWKWQEFEWEGQRRMSQGHVQCVYVYEWGRGGTWWFGRVDKETACGRLSASS